MSDVTTVVDTYLAMFNETDPTRRARNIKLAWAEDGSYLDPLLQGEGHTALDAMAAAVQAQYPGFRFHRTSGIDAHHDLVRFAWELVTPDGTVAAAGIDIGTLAADGRLQRITGFFGEIPQEAAA